MILSSMECMLGSVEAQTTKMNSAKIKVGNSCFSVSSRDG